MTVLPYLVETFRHKDGGPSVKVNFTLSGRDFYERVAFEKYLANLANEGYKFNDYKSTWTTGAF